MRRIWIYLKEYKSLLALSLLLATINQIFSLLDPQIFRILIDRYATISGQYAARDFISGVALLLLASMGVNFVSRVAKNFQNYYVNVIVRRVGARLYASSVSHSFSLAYGVFEDQRSGQLLQNLSKARADAQQLISSFVNTIFLSTVGIVFVLAYAFFVHWSIGVAYILIFPVMGGSLFFITRRIKKVQKTIVAQTADLAGSTTETLRNVELVKSLGLEQQETRRLNDVNEKILGLELQKLKIIRALEFSSGTIINAMRSGIMFLMLYLIWARLITVGEFFSLLFYSFAIFTPLAEFGNFASQYQETAASMDVLEGIFAIKPEEKPRDPFAVSSIDSIAMDRVNFSYNPESKKYAVMGITLDIPKGKTIALAGPSGSGKSTILKLLVGLYRPTAGTVTINTHDAQQIDFDGLKRQIGYVSQDTQLFAGTVRENLLFVNPQASDDQCREALRHAAASTIIEKTGQGLDTKIGEGGLKLSGGERQRLAIARALLRDPQLMIFDEATSSLDSLTEQEITATIREIARQKPQLIMVLVAHRLSTIAHADHIYVLEKGKITESGDHKSLLDQKGLYAALWRQQIAES